MLEAKAITVSFGGVHAVAGVSFEVSAHEILGIIGPNGSGKTTLLNALTGLVPSGGEALLDGKRLDTVNPRRVRERGLMRVFQAPQTFEELTVLENALLSTGDRKQLGIMSSLSTRRAMWKREDERVARAYHWLDRVGLGSMVGVLGAELSYGQRRVLELARALAGNPKALLLDEPSAGLNAAETDWLIGILQSLREEGLSMVLVDHKIDLINGLCDRVAVLENGHRIAYAATADVWADDRVVDAYLGRSHA